MQSLRFFCSLILHPDKTVLNNEGTDKYKNYRIISLTTHASIILTIIIFIRIEQTVESSLDEDQFGFRKERGTKGALFLLQLIQNGN